MGPRLSSEFEFALAKLKYETQAALSRATGNHSICFKDIDTGGDGYIDRAELVAAAALHGMAEEEASELFNKIDIDASGLLDEQEWNCFVSDELSWREKDYGLTQERAQLARTNVFKSHALTNLAVCFGPVEGASASMTTALFILMPLNPSYTGQEPIQWHRAVILWLISMLFEVVIPEGLIAYVSQVLSIRLGEHRFGNMIEALSQNFGYHNMAIITFVTITTVATVQYQLVQSLCPTPHSDGDGLMAFTACCSHMGTPCD